MCIFVYTWLLSPLNKRESVARALPKSDPPLSCAVASQLCCHYQERPPAVPAWGAHLPSRPFQVQRQSGQQGGWFEWVSRYLFLSGCDGTIALRVIALILMIVFNLLLFPFLPAISLLLSQYSDSYYRASLVGSLATYTTPKVSVLQTQEWGSVMCCTLCGFSCHRFYTLVWLPAQ